MSLWRRSLSYLGLAADEWDEHDGYEPHPQQSGSPGPASVQAPAVQPAMPSSVDPETGRVSSVKPVAQSNSSTNATATASGVMVDDEATDGSPRTGSVIQMGRVATAKVHTTSPTSFAHAKDVADHFKADQPVIMNLQGLKRDVARRLIDFASGLCYGLGGKMDKVAEDVFMLTPADVEVSAEDRRRLQERGLYDD